MQPVAMATSGLFSALMITESVTCIPISHNDVVIELEKYEHTNDEQYKICLPFIYVNHVQQKTKYNMIYWIVDNLWCI